MSAPCAKPYFGNSGVPLGVLAWEETPRLEAKGGNRRTAILVSEHFSPTARIEPGSKAV
jgi:hypothetical protein